ncbi:hypothetical protein ACOQNK_17695 [Acinetobacter baumannii]|uniref:hypothetical protein n=1 Tax=Acinetobacter baumannii TaxID=470 RepID=UPI003BAA35DE
MKSLNTFLILFTSFLVIGYISYNRTRTDIVIYKNEGNLHFSFPKNNDVLVYHYEINDYENFESDGMTYKRLFISKEINKEMKEIILENYKSNKIIENHAYYMLLGEQGLKNTSVGFTTIGFCLHKDKILTEQKRENTNAFIQKCHNL